MFARRVTLFRLPFARIPACFPSTMLRFACTTSSLEPSAAAARMIPSAPFVEVAHDEFAEKSTTRCNVATCSPSDKCAGPIALLSTSKIAWSVQMCDVLLCGLPRYELKSDISTGGAHRLWKDYFIDCVGPLLSAGNGGAADFQVEY